MIIDCQRCEARGPACTNCAVSALLGDARDPGAPGSPELDAAEMRALTMLANAGMIPPLRYAPRMARAS